MKSRLELIPWDEAAIVDVPLENLISAAKLWWCRTTTSCPCTIPIDCVLGVGQVLAFGAFKYPENDGRGWETQKPHTLASHQFGALMRHAFTPGLDPESGLLHEWHAASRYMMLATLIARGTVIDDRPARQLRDDEFIMPEGAYAVGRNSGGVS